MFLATDYNLRKHALLYHISQYQYDNLYFFDQVMYMVPWEMQTYCSSIVKNIIIIQEIRIKYPTVSTDWEGKSLNSH